MKPTHARSTLRVALPGTLLALALACGTAAAQAQSGASPPAGSALPTDGVIHDYLVRHPEAVVEALKAAEAKARADETVQARVLIAAHSRELTATPADPVAGNPQGDVTIIEFFDYQCPYCKSMAPTLRQAATRDRGLRVVYKDFPILGPASVTAARAALASRAQDKYLPFHEALMGLKGQLSEDSIMASAAGVGLDTARLKRDMTEPAIDAEIRRNLDLARALKIQGTPAIIVGDMIAPGAVDLDDLQVMVAAARKG